MQSSWLRLFGVMFLLSAATQQIIPLLFNSKEEQPTFSNEAKKLGVESQKNQLLNLIHYQFADAYLNYAVKFAPLLLQSRKFVSIEFDLNKIPSYASDEELEQEKNRTKAECKIIGFTMKITRKSDPSVYCTLNCIKITNTDEYIVEIIQDNHNIFQNLRAVVGYELAKTRAITHQTIVGADGIRYETYCTEYRSGNETDIHKVSVNMLKIKNIKNNPSIINMLNDATEDQITEISLTNTEQGNKIKKAVFEAGLYQIKAIKDNGNWRVIQVIKIENRSSAKRFAEVLADKLGRWWWKNNIKE